MPGLAAYMNETIFSGTVAISAGRADFMLFAVAS
jgi:hypothetical protein